MRARKAGETKANGDRAYWTYTAYGKLASHTDLGRQTSTTTHDPFAGTLTSITSLRPDPAPARPPGRWSARVMCATNTTAPVSRPRPFRPNATCPARPFSSFPARRSTFERIGDQSDPLALQFCWPLCLSFVRQVPGRRRSP